MRLFHFSDDPTIKSFTPRPVRTPVARPKGQDWLNGPLVWAVDDAHAFLYHFPRECPRILAWPNETSSTRDRERWFGDSGSRVVAFVETSWVDLLNTATIFRYELPADDFVDLKDAGMWVRQKVVEPVDRLALDNLPQRLRELSVDLRAVERLTSVRELFNSSLNVSGIRLRNAFDWGEPGWPHLRR